VLFLFNNVPDAGSAIASLGDRIIAEELPAVVARCVRAYLRLAGEGRGDASFWSICPPAVRETQDETMASNDYVYKFLTAGPDGNASRSMCYYVRRVEGSVVEWPDFSNAFDNYIEFKHSNVPAAMAFKLTTKHVAPFTRLGYRIEHTHMCKSCWQVSHVNCCSYYSKPNRSKRYRIRHMELVREARSREPPAATGDLV